MTGPGVDATLAAVRAGIDAVTSRAAAAAPDAPTPCDDWPVVDLVRHLEAIAGAYLLWTGSAVGGRIARMRVADELTRYNESMLERLPRFDVEEHCRRYRELATDHARLARATWTMPMLETPDGTVLEVGRHAGVAAIEWHVHAWDLARAADDVHEPGPDTVEVLAAAWDDTLADVSGVDRDPAPGDWTSVLVAVGRTP